MRKPNIRLLLVLPLLAVLFSFSTANAQALYAPLATEDFSLAVQNLIQPTPNTIEFDVYLLDTDPGQEFEMASIQFGFLLNSGIYTGGTLTATYDNTNSGLNGPQQFTANPSIAPNVNGYPGQTLIRQAGKAPPGFGSGTIISTTGLGTLITRYTITSSVPFTANSTMNLTFTASTSLNPLYATRVAAYIENVNTQLLVTPGVNATVCCNPVLNPATSCDDPIAYNVTGGGSYCEGGVGVPVGLDGSQVGVNYAIVPGTLVVAGDGNAITFGNQLAGSYTVTATSDGSNPAICTDPVTMTGGADVIATPVSTVEFTESACDSYTWDLNGQTYTVSGDYTYVVGCVTNILHLTITPSSTVEVTAAACDSYTWAVNGVTYTASGDYTYVNGCVTNILHLTITPSSTVEETVIACNSYTWAVNGMTYTASGDYTSVDGCVTYVLHLTITSGGTFEFTETACDSYTWAANGVTYTVSGDYTFVDGCITYILHLTIVPGTTEEFTESACDSYTWALNGVTYTVSGDYTYVVGCITNILHLTITPSSTVEFTEAACDSYTWALNGVTYTASGDYTYIVGCVTNILHLTITPSGNNEYTASACDTYTWAISGETYTASGDYTFTNGCSTNILHLTITPSSTVEFTAAACDSYTWALDGITYTTSGDYTYIVGCVTNILHLTITPSSTVESTVAACDSYTWVLNGMTYTVSGDYTYVVGCVTNILHLTITPLPDAAGAISGLAIVTEGDAGVAYSVGAIANATSYVWAYSGTGVTINGSGEAVTLDFAVGATSGTLFVYGANSCGNGDYSFLSISVEPAGTNCTASIWTGVEDGNWFNPANWNPCVPTSETAVTIPGGVPNFPTLYFNASCASILILDGGSFIGAERLDVAQAEVQRYFANSDFHFLSSPVTSINFGTVFPLNQDAVWAREYDEPSGDWVNLFIEDYMEVGKGYSIQMTEPQMATFPGTFNSTDVTKPLSYANTGGDPNRVGWNLLGNPFQSALSWNIILNAGGPIPIVEASAYVWNGVQYVSWNGFTGGLTDGIIPPQNGFFVKAIASGFSFNIPLAARVHSNIPFYKENLANLLQLRTEGNGYNDETFIRFNEEATPLFDGNHDAYKLWGLENAPQLYSIITNEVLSINELPFEGNEVVNLGFKCGVAGTYSLNASGMESFSSSTPILLEDLKLNILQDLRLNPVYSFNYVTNDNEARFKLHFKAATGISDPANNGIFVYSYERTVVINNTTGLNGEVSIFDMTGREIKDTNMSSTSVTRIPMQAAVGTYIVKVTTAQGTVNQKVFIK